MIDWIIESAFTGFLMNFLITSGNRLSYKVTQDNYEKIKNICMTRQNTNSIVSVKFLYFLKYINLIPLLVKLKGISI